MKYGVKRCTFVRIETNWVVIMAILISVYQNVKILYIRISERKIKEYIENSLVQQYYIRISKISEYEISDLVAPGHCIFILRFDYFAWKCEIGTLLNFRGNMIYASPLLTFVKNFTCVAIH
jgi:hypothetical protein